MTKRLLTIIGEWVLPAFIIARTHSRADDGRMNVDLAEILRLFEFPLQDYLSGEMEEASALPPYISSMTEGIGGESRPPTLNVVMHVARCGREFRPFLALR